MDYRIVVKGPEGDKIELLATGDSKIADGALLGAQALLDLLSDEMDLEDGYEILQEEGNFKNPPDLHKDRYNITY